MRRINARKPTGLTAMGLRSWGIVFSILGIIGRSIVENRLVPLYEGSEHAMLYMTVAIILQAMGTIAATIFAFLLVEGVKNTSSLKNYFLRVFGLALITEIPFDLAMTGKIINMRTNNPVFGLVICLVLLYSYRLFSKKSIKNFFIKFAITFAAIFWSLMFKIEAGLCCVLVCASLWALRKKPLFQNMFGCAMAALSTIAGNLYYIFSPMGFFFIHSYNGEKGEGKRLVNYLAYPVLLLMVAGAGAYLFK